MATAANRKRLLKMIVDTINKEPELTFPKDKLIAMLMYDEGVTEKTAKDYLDTVVRAGMVMDTGTALQSWLDDDKSA